MPTGVQHAFSGHRGHLKTVTLSLGSEMSSRGKGPGGARKPLLSFREGCRSRE